MDTSDKTQDLLSSFEAEIRERRMAKALRKLKLGRYILFGIALVNIAPKLVQYGNDAHGDLGELYKAAGLSIFFFTAFVVSRYKPHGALLIATVVYAVVGAWWLWNTTRSPGDLIAFQINPVFFQLIIIIALFIKLIVLFYLANSTLNARKYEALEKEENDAHEGDGVE